MNVWMFGMFGIKTPIHAFKIEDFGQFHPLYGQRYQRNPQTAHPSASLRCLNHQARKYVDESDL